ncbi:MAG: FliH/SctL family protein [Candidatus Velthaea sp.]
MHERRFIPLGEWLRPPEPTRPLAAEEPCALPPSAAAAPRDIANAVRDARVFRAALADAFDGMLERVLRDVGTAVLARELQLAPVDIEALVRTLVRERCTEAPVRVRVAPADAAIRCGIPVVVDATLEPGDAILEVAHGTIDARLGVRLADVLTAVQP